MESRIAIVAIVVENVDSTEKINEVLHDYGNCIIGRMGIPYRDKNLNLISIAVDAPQEMISALSGKLGKIDGVTAKTVYATK